MLLFIIELFTPTFGVVGISGVGMLVYACILAWLKLSPAWSLVISGVSVVTLVAIIKIFPHTSIAKRLRLEMRVDRKSGFEVGGKEFNALTGKSGIALSSLRPAGTALIEGERIDVLTEGEYIEKDTRIRVERVEGNRIFVRKTE
jgi:membrane-bound serine protease (ClpP class)